MVGHLYGKLSDQQKKDVCFDWDHQDKKRGLLRTFVANNWNITKQEINSDFYNDEQRDLVKQVFESIVHPDWHERYYQQLEDDAGGFGNEQSIAIFGKPGDGKFEMVITGRHMTLRCDGNSTDHVAFGGPIFYGHAPEFNENPKHTDNVFWHQAVAANKLYQMLDGRQQKQALLPKTPREQAVGFRGPKAELPGLPVTDMSADQKNTCKKCWRCWSNRIDKAIAMKPTSALRRKADWTPARCRSTATRTSARTRSGTTGGWKAPRLSGTIAVHRTCTCGSTWPIHPTSN